MNISKQTSVATMMFDKYSYFIEGKAIFGSFPTQEDVDKLESLGVCFFVDLTSSHESKLVPYIARNARIIRYPIPDNGIPTDKQSFLSFVLNLYKIICNLPTETKMYIHCKGGHGRSGIVVATLLALYHKISGLDAIKMTTMYHNNRLVMRDKWRRIGSPQTHQQKLFVLSLFEKS